MLNMSTCTRSSSEKSSAQAVRNIIELVETDEKQEKLVTALTVLESTHTPVAVSAYNIMEDLGTILVTTDQQIWATLRATYMPGLP